MLDYTGDIQRTPLSIAGRVLAELWASADARDADWAVKLVDVAPDGVARGIAEGILRSSTRDPSKYPALLEPGRRYRFTIDLGHTAATILPGHALRVEIAGSAFPMFDRKGGCAGCHMAKGRGKAVGPDLSSVGREMTLAEVDKAVRRPSARIKPGYKVVTLRLRDGRGPRIR